jgi:hypothetical protein
MKRVRKLMLAVVALVGCSPEGSLGGLDESDVQSSQSAMKAAHQTIMITRPKASSLFVDQLNLVLANHGINLFVKAEDVEARMLSSMTDGKPTATCQVQTSGAASQSCRSLVEEAVKDAVKAAPTLTTTNQRSAMSANSFWGLTDDELSWVKGWAGEAVLSGIDTAAVHALALLRAAKVCDVSAADLQSASDLGEAQGKSLLEAAEQKLLPATSTGLCNTDVIAASIRAEAEGQVDAFIASHPLCASTGKAQAEQDRRDGLEEGIRQAYEALRVRLVSTWSCDPNKSKTSAGSATGPGVATIPSTPSVPTVPNTPTTPTTPTTPGTPNTPNTPNNNGGGTPDWGSWLNLGMGLLNSFSFGEPLVIDLDGTGVQFTDKWASFDLAATGQLVKMPVLSRGSALLALDQDGNGRIDSGAELLGNAGSCGARRCIDGIDALAAHDANHDGVIDSHDAVYGKLLLWRDQNGDGVSQPGELVSIREAGIAAISLDARTDRAWTHQAGHAALRSLTFAKQDGTAGMIHDVWFSLRFDRMPSDPATTGIVSTLRERR